MNAAENNAFTHVQQRFSLAAGGSLTLATTPVASFLRARSTAAFSAVPGRGLTYPRPPLFVVMARTDPAATARPKASSAMDVSTPSSEEGIKAEPRYVALVKRTKDKAVQ